MVRPDDFAEVRSQVGVAFARPPVESWVRSILTRGDTLYEAAARDPHHRPMRGRGTVYLIEVDGVQCVVRRYLRGGGMRFLGELYLRGGEPRPQREAFASQEATRRGIRTPPVLAWSVYPAGPFYRADLVTGFMPESDTLAALLFELATPADDRRRALEAAGGLVAQMAAAGITHADLNAKNILLQRSDVRYEAAALDLDRMVVSGDGRAIDPAPMLARLERSIRKLAQEHTEGVSPAEWESLRAGATVAGGAV